MFLLLSVLMLSVYTAQAQETKKITKEKKIVIIKKDDHGKTVRKEITTEGEGLEAKFNDQEIDSIVNSLLLEMNIENDSDNIQKKVIKITTNGAESEGTDISAKEIMKNIEIDIDDETGEQHIVMKIVSDGKEEMMEWNGSADEVIPTEFEVEVDESYVDVEKLPIPTVSMGVAITEEVKIEEVMPNSAAQSAGLLKGDKILQIDNQIIYSNRGLLEHLCSYQPNQKIKVFVLRNNQRKKIKMTLQAR